MQDLIICDDKELRHAMESYEHGNTSALESFLRKSRSRQGTAASLDLVDGLDLDFLAVMKDSDDLPFNFGEEEEDPLAGSLHDFVLPYSFSHELPDTALGSRVAANRKMSFDSLFEPLSFEQTPRSDSISSIGLSYGLPLTGSTFIESSDSDIDKSADFFGDESPYVRMARSLEAKNDKVPGPGRSTRQRVRGVQAAVPQQPQPQPLTSRRPSDRSLRKPEERPLRRAAEVVRVPEPVAPPSQPRLPDPALSASINKSSPLTPAQALQLPKHSMADGPPLSKLLGAYSKENRRERIERFLAKRDRRVWTKKVKYDVRKNFADSRVRVKGRFVKKEAEDVLKQLLDPIIAPGPEPEIAHAG